MHKKSKMNGFFQVKCYGECLKTLPLSQLHAYHATIKQGQDIIVVKKTFIVAIPKKPN